MLDKTDLNILGMLIQNSRQPMNKIAKKTRISREVADYRLKKLVRKGIILKFTTNINLEKIGFIGAAVFINLKTSEQERFKEYLENSSFVSWVAELSGVWSFGFSIIGRNNDELDSRFLQIHEQFKESIINHRFTIHKRSSFFYEKYFGEKPSKEKDDLRKDLNYKIDREDKIIIQELSNNSRKTTTKIAEKTSMTAPAIAQRIKKLEEKGIIEKYSLFIDISKIGLFQYSIFITNKKIEEKELLTNYLKEHENVSFIAEYIGEQFIEFGIVIKDPYELREKLQEIEERYPENRIMEVSMFQKEFISIGPPRCVFREKDI